MRPGEPHTPETRAKMSAAQLGKKKSPEARANMSAAQTGRKHTPETRAKIGSTKKGKAQSPEWIAARVEGWRNPESQAKIKATWAETRRQRRLAVHAAIMDAIDAITGNHHGAREIVTAIIEGRIPHVIIKYGQKP